jgi:hypothetical protein
MTHINTEELHVEIERDMIGNYRTKPLSEMLTECCTEGPRNYHLTAYQTEYQTTIPKAYQMTTEKTTDIVSKLPAEMATEKLTKNAPKLSS